MPARHRGAFRGPSAAIAANHPLAAQEGLRVLHAGGSAADAAIAAAMVMVVVRPDNSHLGGDLFAMTYEAASQRIDALNSSGAATRRRVWGITRRWVVFRGAGRYR